jgi:hypothetical protein
VRSRHAALLAVVVSTSCGGDRTSPTAPASPGALALRLETAHFSLYADAVPDATLRELAAALEGRLPGYQRDLGVTVTRALTVRVWQDPTAWAAEVRRYFGRAIDASGYVTGPDEIRVLAGPRLPRDATHELAHCVSLVLNPSIANNPRWLWESVALWENGELVDPRTLAYMVAGRPPTLEELNADVSAGRQVYDVGYTIGEFVVWRGGNEALGRLVVSNGDTAGALGLSPRAFEEEWYAFVLEKYLAASAGVSPSSQAAQSEGAFRAPGVS